jgi:hypothetical protein
LERGENTLLTEVFPEPDVLPPEVKVIDGVDAGRDGGAAHWAAPVAPGLEPRSKANEAEDVAALGQLDGFLCDSLGSGNAKLLVANVTGCQQLALLFQRKVERARGDAYSSRPSH